MIRHICMFKLKAENKECNIKEFFSRIETLRTLPQVKHFEVVRNVSGTPDSNYDVSLIFDFETVDDLNSYQSHPLHVEFGKFVVTVREERACIDYEF